MTNEEAISILKNAAFLSTETKYQAIEEAVNMAITALQTDGDCISRQEAIRIASGYCHPANVAKELAKLPSAQPEVAKNTNVPINDCVSRQAMFETVAEYEKELRKILGDENGLVEVVKILKHRLIALPSAQPLVIHCTDCEDWYKRQSVWNVAISELPSAQPDIIRCKDCKHWREGNAFSYCDKLHGMGVLDALDYMTAEDDYCSMAERRNDETD